MTISSSGTSGTSGTSGASGTSGMSGTSGTSGLPDKQTFGAMVVKGTLDTLNSGSMSGTGKNSDSDYDFQTKVLSAGPKAMGNLVNGKI